MRLLASVPRTVWLLLALALAVRVAVVLLTGDFRPVADPAEYDRYARALADTGSFPGSGLPVEGPTAYRPPAYPLFLGALYEVFGPSWTAARLVQALVGTLTVALTGLLALQLFGRSVALAALALGAVFLPLATVGASLLTEPLLVPLVLGAVCATLHARSAAQPARWLVLAGALAGLATLTRPNAALLVVPLALGALQGVRPSAYGAGVRRRAWAPVVVVLAAVLVVAPWTVRNAVTLDAFVPVSTQDGFTLAGTYNDLARDQPSEPAAWVEWYRVPRFLEAAQRLPEVPLSERLRGDAVDYAREHPGYVAEVGWWNLRRLAHLSGLDFVRFDVRATGLPGWLGIASAVCFWLLAPLALAGALRARRRGRGGGGQSWVWLVPAAFAATVFVVAYARFRAPVDPFLVVLAAVALRAR